MNLAEALQVALPPLPASHASSRLPRLTDNLLTREEIDTGVTTVLVMKSGSDGFYRLTPRQWQIARLFDGKRSFAAVAEQARLHRIQCDETEVRELAETLSDTDMLDKPAAEKVTAMAEYLRRDRRRRSKFRLGDFSEITIFSFDPDAWLTRLYPYLRFIYTPWFTVVTLLAFAWMALVLVGHGSEILRDTGTYYTFSQKGVRDLAEFWVLLLIVGAIHETAHGLTCKHYGGGVHRMGFLLMYSLPCFFCDTSEAWLYTGRFGRILTMFAGMWIELTLCVFATTAWWATAPGTWVHDMAYKVILFTGIAVVVMNINPLVKLDGYFLLCEFLRIGDLKEKSTAYTSSWVRNKLFRLPVDLEYVPPRRRPLFIGYALASGAYSYVLLFIIVGFSDNVFSRLTPDWAFLPVLGIIFVLFKSRLVLLEKFMRTVYLDKKERLRSYLLSRRAAIVAALATLLLFLPVWPHFVEGRFELYAHNRAVMRTEVGGTVSGVFAGEGQQVQAGAPLVRLENLTLESEAAQAQADLRVAQARSVQAELRYSGWAPAEQRRQQLAQRNRLVQEQLAKLRISSPMAGTVTTPRVGDLAGSYLPAGTPVLEIADFSTLEARVYLPEYEVRDLRPYARSELLLDSASGFVPGTLRALASVSSQPPTQLVPQQQSFKGLQSSPYYVAWVKISDTRGLRENMSGTAKIFVRRQSLAEATWRAISDAVQRKIW
ncbi:MAG TPA: HlyD family efflux transporter periplasmic adaptor subunit [Terriglobales bacterium]|nr:HlyD family efflux transporter periplasmic adaptor subunit [Terriglobales bacterium]